jgi:hypothetical protein
MEFLERAAKSSIAKLERLDKEIQSNSKVNKTTNSTTNNNNESDGREQITKEEHLLLRTIKLLEIREAQKRELEHTLFNESSSSSTTTTILSNSTMRQQKERIERFNAQIQQERRLRASIEAKMNNEDYGIDNNNSTTTATAAFVQALVLAQNQLAFETRKRDTSLESFLTAERKRDDAKMNLEKIELKMKAVSEEHERLGDDEYDEESMKLYESELKRLREEIDKRNEILNNKSKNNYPSSSLLTTPPSSSSSSFVKNPELEVSLNAKTDELIQAQIAVEKVTSEFNIVMMRLDAASKSKSMKFASYDPMARRDDNLLYQEDHRNVFEHFERHLAKYRLFGYRRARKLVWFFAELDRATKHYTRTATGNSTYGILGFTYIAIVFSYAFLRFSF